MKSNREKSTTIAGLLYLSGIVVGILSIAYAVDDPEYLIKASSSTTSVIIAAFFHFLLAPIYLGVAISLYPILKKSNQWLAFGFVSFRIIASVCIIIGVIILFLLLALSQEYVSIGTPDFPYYHTLGGLLQVARDFTNHVATILSLSFGGILFYIVLLKEKLVPQWLAVWGLLATVLTIIASCLVMFQVVEVITKMYILMNMPMALQDVVLVPYS